MASATRPYCYVHPEHLCATYKGMESSTQLLFACPDCGKKASFSLPEHVAAVLSVGSEGYFSGFPSG
jgi:hypothetical protein